MIALPILIKKQLEDANYKYLGYANGWKSGEFPKEYNECIAQGHQLDDVSLNRNRTNNVYSCDKCKFYYCVDSSD